MKRASLGANARVASTALVMCPCELRNAEKSNDLYIGNEADAPEVAGVV